MILPTPESPLLDTLTPAQFDVLKLLVAGESVTAAARQVGLHRSTIHLWTRQNPDFVRALLAGRQDRASRLADELADLADLALDTFRQILTDEKAPASVRLKAAMEIARLVESQRPTPLAATLNEATVNPVPSTEPARQPGRLASTSRNAPCPCGSPLKYKRCCGLLLPQSRAA